MNTVSQTAERLPSQRMLSLDVLRAVAVLIVLGKHGILGVGDGGVFHNVALKFRWFGWVGVDLFFVLSGFLIGGLLFAEIKRTGTLDIPRFLTRRAFKIWPSYFVFIFTGMVLEAQGARGWAGSLREFWPNLCHLQSYIMAPEFYRHTWSLAVEEHFYLLLPLALWFFLGRNRGTQTVSVAFLGGLFAAMVLVLVVRYFHAIRVPYGWSSHYTATHLRFDSLLFGVALAYLRSAHPRHFNRVAGHPGLLLALCVAILVPVSRFALSNFFTYTAGFTLIYIAWGAALVAFVGCEGRPGLLWTLVNSLPGRALAMIGTWSYSIYLWQLFGESWAIKLSVTCFAGLSPSFRYLATTGTYLGFAILLGVIMNKLVEAPMLALRERVTRVRARVGGDRACNLPLSPAAAFAEPEA